jgi:hypothetical protein
MALVSWRRGVVVLLLLWRSEGLLKSFAGGKEGEVLGDELGRSSELHFSAS